MQQQLRLAVIQLIPLKRRQGERQGWERKEIVAGRTAACRALEHVIDEAIAAGVPDADVERVGLVLLDGIRQKLEARGRSAQATQYPLAVQSLGEAIRAEEQLEGEMAAVEIECLTAPTPGKLSRLRDLAMLLEASMLRLRRAIEAELQRAFL